MIYLLEDDDSIRELVVYSLSKSQLPARGFSLPSAFWEALETDMPSLVLLDIMLPEEDGLSILKQLRARKDTADIPVMMLTAKGSEYDKVVGLDGGADDYLAKPFGIMELVSRVRALLRRTKKAAPPLLSAGGVEMNVPEHWVRSDGQYVVLTLKEFELLQLLLSNQGVVFTRDQLLSQIWGYEYSGESRTVDVHVRTLRLKLGENGGLIETVRGVGYKIGGGTT